jgi:hypothetical protein
LPLKNYEELKEETENTEGKTKGRRKKREEGEKDISILKTIR